MTKKFTEEEYQKIVEIADNQIKEHNRSVITATSSFLETIRRECQEVIDYNKLWDLEQEFIIICLPKYREWAHDQFVEKEKKYYWKYKNPDVYNTFLHLNKVQGIVRLSYLNRCPLTEKEIIETGYNPDMFEKKEVE